MEKENEFIEDYLEVYAIHNLEDLKTLREALKKENNNLIENHWLKRFENRYTFKLRILLLIITILSLLCVIGPLLWLMGVVIFKQGNLNISLFDKLPYLIFFLIIGVVGMALLSNSNDKVKRKLKAINMIIKEKETFQTNKDILVDSNIIDDLISNKITEKEIKEAKQKGFNFFITHIQSDEISKCKNEEKRAKLTLFLTKLSPKIVETESLVMDLSRLDYAKMGAGDIMRKITGDTKDLRKYKDGLIGETALAKNYILLTNDTILSKKIKKIGGNSISSEEFKNLIKIVN